MNRVIQKAPFKTGGEVEKCLSALRMPSQTSLKSYALTRLVLGAPRFSPIFYLNIFYPLLLSLSSAQPNYVSFLLKMILSKMILSKTTKYTGLS